MPEFKLVISDPTPASPAIKVKVVGDEKIALSKEQKEGRRLPVAELSKALAEKLGVDESSAITLKFALEGGKVVKLHFKASAKEGTEENVIRVPQDILTEKVGEMEAEAEAFKSKAFQLILDDSTSRRFIGMKIGDEIDGVIVGLSGKLRIKGGSDSSGFPMRPDIPGPVKKRILLSSPPGFHPRSRGERRRKIVRGNTIDESIVQINAVLVREKGAEKK
ncbi:MAG: 30S ribosomal protein S6e [Desulfurococcales archaeon]|jgi:small subunit ribosomal protein S6e